MKVNLAVCVYLGAIILANLTLLWFGPSAAIVNAFLLIGLDLSLRDRLHEAWSGKALWAKMLVLVASQFLKSMESVAAEKKKTGLMAPATSKEPEGSADGERANFTVIDASDSDSENRHAFEHLSRSDSTKFSHFRTAPNSRSKPNVANKGQFFHH